MIRITRIGSALFACLPVAALGGGPAVLDLGENILPQAISGNGAVVVGFSVREDRSGVFRWTAKDGTRVIGGETLGLPDVSADGRTIAGTVLADGLEAAYWTEQKGWVPLSASGMIPALPGWNTITQAISANGKRLAGGTVPPPIEYDWQRAFSFNPDPWPDDGRWADVGWKELPNAGKSSFSWANAISNDGRVQVGTSSERSSWYFAVRWVDGQLEVLRDATGARLGGESVVCNSDCTEIAGGGGPSSAERPVLAWSMRTNKRAPACYFQPMDPTLLHLRHYAVDLSDNGELVTGAYYYVVIEDTGEARSVAKGFLWFADKHGGTLVDVQDYLAARKQSSLSAWTDVVPTAVSNDGRYLAGWGVDAKGSLRGWRVDLGIGHHATASLPRRSRYTRCPTHANPRSMGDQIEESTQTQASSRPDGAFRTADGREYELRARGAQLHGGPSEQQMQRLLPLGGEHYYDKRARERLSVVRDVAGNVTAIRGQREDAARIYYRQGG